MLLTHVNRAVPADDLVATLWPAGPPASHQANLQTYVSRLRRVLPDATIDHDDGTYRLVVDETEVDLCVYRAAAATARRHAEAGRFADAAAWFRRAVAVWRGDPLTGVSAPTLTGTRTALRQDHWALVEDRLDAEIAAGHGAELVGELTGRLTEQPLRDRLRAALMRALVAAGRPADAIAVYEQGRALLAETLGVDPAAPLRELHLAILRDELEVPSRPGATPFPVRQLPADLADYTGRAAQIAAGAATLTATDRAVPVLVVAGAPGVGKTAFAVHLAHRLGERFPDGQLFVRLGRRAGPPTEVDLLGRLLRALGVAAADLPGELADRIDLYRSRLAGRRVLVVLDDAQRPAQVRPLVPGTPGCAVLVTSRHRLTGLAPTRLELLRRLPPDESVAMLTVAAGADRTGAEPAAARRIALACGHVPLALRVAGARLASRPDWSLDQLADRLDDSARRLDELSVPDLTVRAALADAYAGLDEPAGRMLRLLALHGPSEFAAWAASALVASVDAEPVLDRLVEANLVEPVGADAAGQLRYRMHDLLRDFGTERALDEDPAPARATALDRLAETAIRLAAAATTNIPESPFESSDPVPEPEPELAAHLIRPAATNGPRWLAIEYPHLVGLGDRLCDVPPLSRVTRLATRVTGHLWRDGHGADLSRMYRRINLAARAAADDGAAAHSRYAIAQADVLSGRLPAALDGFAECVALARSLGDRTLLGVSLAAVGGQVGGVQGPDERAVRLCREAVEIFTELGDRRREASALRALSLAHNELGQFDRAADAIRRAYQIVTEVDVDGVVDPMLAQQVLNAYVPIQLAMGRPDLARSAAQRGVRLAERIDDHEGAASMRAQLGLAAVALGDVATAVRLFAEVRETTLRSGNEMAVAMMTRNIAAADAGAGRTEDAIGQLRRCLAEFGRLGQTRLANETRHLLAAALRRAGAVADADATTAAAYPPSGYSAERVRILLRLVEPAPTDPAAGRAGASRPDTCREIVPHTERSHRDPAHHRPPHGRA